MNEQQIRVILEQHTTKCPGDYAKGRLFTLLTEVGQHEGTY